MILPGKVVMMRECRVCQSPHLIDYNKMKERGYTAKDIWKESQRRGEVIPYKSFTRHFNQCWKTKKKFFFKESTDLAQEMVARKFVEQMNIIDEIGHSLGVIKEHLQKLEGEIKEGSVDWKELLGCLAEIRLILQFLWKISKEIEIKPTVSIDKIREKLLVALRDIPYEHAQKIEKALEL